MKPKRRILLVDDEADVRKVTKVRLEHEGYDVVVATNGEQAVARANTDLPIHLVLLDIRLPRLNGYEVCRHLKAQSSTASIPILLFTASESQAAHLTDRCIEVGANDWIKKPFRSNELMEKVHRLVAQAEEGMSDG